MKASLTKSIKNLFVFVFLFAVLERTGVDLVSLMNWKLCVGNAIDVFDTESTAKESEKNEDKTLKEVWICLIYQTLLKPLSQDTLSQKLIKNINTEHNFYPSVPTPPPDLISA